MMMKKVFIFLAIVLVVATAGCIKEEKKNVDINYQDDEFLTWFQITSKTMQLYLNYTTDALTSHNWQEAKFWAEELMNFSDEQMTACMTFYLSEKYDTLRDRYYQVLNDIYLASYYTEQAVIDLENYDYDSMDENIDRAVDYFHQTKVDLDICIQIIHSWGIE